ncbi:MAG: CheR family methyltransferase [Planctomycetota bacterium]
MTAHLDQVDIAALLAIVESRLGLHFNDSRLGEVRDVIRRRASSAGGHAAYMQRLLGTESGGEEFAWLARALTVGETFFFRHNEQFQALIGATVPALAREAGARPLRVLSAGCATGEEPYTVAIALREAGLPATGNVGIVGADINRAAVEAAREGLYSQWSLRSTPDAIRERWFREEHGRFRVAEAVRRDVRFVEANITREDDPLWELGPFDVIFCRNVTIYFAGDTVQRVLRHLTESLRHGGYMFLGHAETLRWTDVAGEFRLHHTHDTFYYERLAEPASQLRYAPLQATAAPAPTVPPPAASTAAAPAPAAAPAWHDVVADVGMRIADMADAAMAGTRQPASPVAGSVRETDDPLDIVRDHIGFQRNADALAAARALPPAVRDSPAAQLLIAIALVNCGDTRGALTALEAGDAGQMDPVGCYLRALLHVASGDIAAGVAQAETATWLDGTFALAWQLLGRLRQQAGNAERALEALRQAALAMPFEKPLRIRLLGGGFSRDQLQRVCDREVEQSGR